MLTLQDVKNRFSAVVDAQEVSRRGKPAVVIISVTEYHRLVAAARGHRGSFTDHLMAFPGAGPSERMEARPRDVDL